MNPSKSPTRWQAFARPPAPYLTRYLPRNSLPGKMFEETLKDFRYCLRSIHMNATTATRSADRKIHWEYLWHARFFLPAFSLH